MATATATRNKITGNAPEVHSSDVEAQFTQIREDIANLTKTITAYGASKAGKYAGQAEKAGLNLADASHNALENVREEVKSVEKGFEAQVRNNPLQAVGIAAGIGFLLAFMTRH